MLAEATAPGATISAVARRHGLPPAQVYKWRRLAELGVVGVPGASELPSLALLLASVPRPASGIRPAPQPFPDNLPRERVVEPGPAVCLCCSSPRPRKTFTCRDCGKISQAPAPFSVLARGWAGPSLLDDDPVREVRAAPAASVIGPLAVRTVIQRAGPYFCPWSADRHMMRTKETTGSNLYHALEATAARASSAILVPARDLSGRCFRSSAERWMSVIISAQLAAWWSSGRAGEIATS